MSLHDDIADTIKQSILTNVPNSTELNPVTHVHDDSLNQACSAIADGVMLMISSSLAPTSVINWNNTTPYDINDIVAGSNHVMYISQADANLNHNPVTAGPTYWKPATFASLIEFLFDALNNQAYGQN